MAITKATVSNGVLTINAAAAAALTLQYDESITTTDPTDKEDSIFGADVAKYGQNVETIDASKLAKKAPLTIDLSDAGNVTEITGGKGDDVYIIDPTKEVNVSINDFSTTDKIKLTSTDNVSYNSYDFTFGKTVVLTLGSTTINLVGAAGKLINIYDNEDTPNLLFSQSFQDVTDNSYTADNANTGAVLTTEATTIDASKRKNPLTINAKATEEKVTITGGTGADTVIAASDAQIAGGKGNDYFVVNSGNNLTITDYEFGGTKDVIQIGSDLTYEGNYKASDEDIIIYFSATNGDGTKNTQAASVTIKNALWNQIAKESTKMVKIVNSAGTEVVNKAFADPAVLVVTGKLDKGEAIDLSDAASIAGQEIGSAVRTIQFNGSTAVSITGGGVYQSVQGGTGADTIRGTEAASGGAVTVTDVIDAGTFTSTEYPTFETGNITFKYTGELSDGDHDIYVKLTYSPGVNDSEATVSSVFIVDDGTSDGTISSSQFENGDVTIGNLKFTFNNISALKTKTFDVRGLATTTNDARTAFASEIASYLWDNDGAGTTVVYSYDPSTAYSGGAGNDYLYGYNGGGKFYGDAGNDTLRGGEGNTNLTGGAGNDIFLLTGEGYTETDEDGEVVSTTTHTIKDYNSGAGYKGIAKADLSKLNKELGTGTDKIQVAWDNYKTKNLTAGMSGKASVIGGELTDDGLAVKVQGVFWKDAEGTYGEEGYKFGDFDETNVESATYVFSSLKNDSIISIIDQGITYKQVVSNAENVELTAADYSNYLGLLNNNVKTIDASKMTKGQRLVAGVQTNAITGSGKVDTIIGNGGTAMTGGEGNDVFVVKNGDSITDYNAAAKDKDVIRLADGLTFDSFSNQAVAAYNAQTTFNFDKSVSGGDTDDDGNKIYTLELANGDEATIAIDSDSKVVSIFAKGNDVTYRTNLGLDLSKIAAITSVTPANVKSALQTAFNADSYNQRIVYTVNAVENEFVNSVNTDTGIVSIGDITLTGGTGKDVTFTKVTEQKVEGTSKAAVGTYTGTKLVTDTMIRKFTGSDTLAGGKGNYLAAYAGVDDAVKVIQGGATAATIVNSAENVETIVGGAKADTIVVGRNTLEGSQIEVISGKGNDVIIWNGEQDVVVTDFTKVSYNTKTSKITAGDVILLDGFNTSQLSTSFVGSDVYLTVKDGVDEAAGKDATLVLKGAKDMTAYIRTADGYNATATVAADAIATLANPNEYIIDKTAGFVAASVTSGINIVNSVNFSGSKSAPAVINLTTEGIGANVKEVYGGKGADTIYAQAATNYIDGAAGNDVIFVGANADQTIKTDAGTDILAFNQVTSGANILVTDYTVGTDKLYLGDDVSIKSAALGTANGVVDSTTKKNTISYYSDVTVVLTDGTNEETVTLQKVEQKVETLKNNVVSKTTTSGNLTIVRGTTDGQPTPLAKTATTYSMDYANEAITVGGGKNGTDFDLTGANAITVSVSGAGKNITVAGAQSGAAVTAADGKNPAFFVGNYVENAYEYSKDVYYKYTNNAGKDAYDKFAVETVVGGAYFTGNDGIYDEDGDQLYPEATYKNQAVTFKGGAGADVYYGNGAWDTVNLGAGNDTFRAGENGVVRAQITSGQPDSKTKSANTFVVGAGDEYHISNFSAATDKIVIDSVSSALSSEMITNEDYSKDLKLTFQVGTDDETSETATVLIQGYNGTDKIAVSRLELNAKNKVVLTAVSDFSYGNSTLTLTNADVGPVVASDAINGANVTKINAEARTSALNITGSASTTEIIGGSGANIITFDSAVNDATVTGGKGNDTFVFSPGTYTSGTSNLTKKLTVTDYTTGTNIVSVEGAFAGEGDLADYSSKVSFVTTDEGVDLVLTDEDKAEVVLKNAVTVKGTTRSASKITINGNKNLSFSDPENVVLTNKSITNFSAAGVGDRVKTMNASKAASGVTLVAGTVLTSYTGSAKGDTVTLSTTEGASNVAITSGAGSDKFAFGAGNDKYTYNGGADEITNFAASGDDEIVLNGWKVDESTVDITVNDTSATVKVDLTKSKSKGSLTITGTIGDNFNVTADSYNIKGLGEYTAEAEESGEEMRAFVETADLYNDFVEADSLGDITAKTVDEAAITADFTTDFTKSANAFNIASSALTTNKKNNK